MMTGRVNRKRQPRLRIRVRGLDRRSRLISAIVDTGYDGFLTLPLKTIGHLKLGRFGYGWATLADDSRHQFDAYRAEVEWNGRWRRVTIAGCGSVPCIGMRLLDGFELQLQGRIGGQLTIEIDGPTTTGS